MFHGESNGVDEDQVIEWLEKLPNLINGYADEDIYNADEAGFNWKAQPRYSFVRKGLDSHGNKIDKIKLSILVCVNKSGWKQPLLVIGKSKKPRWLKTCIIDLKSLNIEYVCSGHGWMETEIFNRWLAEWNEKLKSENRKIILFVGQCPSHKLTSEYEQISVIKLPKNTTSRLQPADAGIIANLKRNYRELLMSKILPQVEGDSTFDEAIKTITLPEALKMGSWSSSGNNRNGGDDNDGENGSDSRSGEVATHSDTSIYEESTLPIVSDDILEMTLDEQNAWIKESSANKQGLTLTEQEKEAQEYTDPSPGFIPICLLWNEGRVFKISQTTCISS
ncbi:tigger transposable element-derived protein 4-like [Panonychus citri]|uniref:tigger transposable element-derived protein 4-like n=1 Tax=Panonychus citri TaxID=50023 RepID=UPI00230764A5|nr:tigger transposable element-derived protein 4-like [Panonychus citri]